MKKRNSWWRRENARLGRHWPKRMPSKLVHSMLWIDGVWFGPVPGRGLRKWVKSARRKEARLAWHEALEDEAAEVRHRP